VGDFPRPGDEWTEPAKNRLVALKVAVLLERLHRALQVRPPRPTIPSWVSTASGSGVDRFSED
jgi:hypothetical protein